MHANSPTQEYIIADGDSDDRSTDPYNRQAFRDEAGDEVALPWFGTSGDPFDEIKVSNTCGCQKPTSPPSDQQDATRFALRFHNGDKWRFECNNQPGFALCQKDLGRFPP